jgi:hypothetical protein
MGKPATKKELRTFGISLGVVCLLWAALLWWRGHPAPVPWLVGASPVLVGLALLWPAALGPLHRVWMPAAKGLAKVLTWVLLAVVFYLVFTPFGLAMRLFGRDPLERRIRRGPGSYWIRRGDGPFDPSRLDRQF